MVREETERFLTRRRLYRGHGGRRHWKGCDSRRELHQAEITLDVMMPDLDGWTVLAAIKGDPHSGGYSGNIHDNPG